MVNRYQQVITLVVLAVVFTGILDGPLNFLHNAVYGLILRMFGFHLVLI